MRWEAERSCDGKLCQEYLDQKLSKSSTGFQVTVENVGDAFLRDNVYNLPVTTH